MVFNRASALNVSRAWKAFSVSSFMFKMNGGWNDGRGLFGDVLLRASPFDPVALRHQGIADFGVEENIRHSDEHGFLVCRFVVVIGDSESVDGASLRTGQTGKTVDQIDQSVQ